MYNAKVANIALAFFFGGFNVLYTAMMIVGVKGMPRRYYDYLPEFTFWNVVATVASWFMIFGILLMIANLLIAARKGKKAPRNPWGGVTLEWQTLSPPTHHNFDKMPVLSEKGPYDFEKIPYYDEKAE